MIKNKHQIYWVWWLMRLWICFQITHIPNGLGNICISFRAFFKIFCRLELSPHCLGQEYPWTGIFYSQCLADHMGKISLRGWKKVSSSSWIRGFIRGDNSQNNVKIHFLSDIVTQKHSFTILVSRISLKSDQNPIEQGCVATTVCKLFVIDVTLL